MDKFNDFEYDTLMKFLPFIEQKINSSYKKSIIAGELPEDIANNPNVLNSYIRSVNNFSRNVEAIKKNRPGSLTGEQWDDLLFMFFSTEHDVAHNTMIQPVFGKQASKCYQILLSKRAERLEPFKSAAQENPSESQNAGQLTYADLARLEDTRNKAFNRGVIALLIAFLCILAFVVIMILNHHAFLAWFVLFFASIGIAAAVFILSKYRRIGKEINDQGKQDPHTSADEHVLQMISDGVSVEGIVDTSSGRFANEVKDPDDYCLNTQPADYAAECQENGKRLAAKSLALPPTNRYLNATLLRYDLLGIGQCMTEHITQAGCKLILTTCCQACELVREDAPDDNRRLILAMVEKTARDVMSIDLESIEGKNILRGCLFAETADYIHAFDLFLNLYRVFQNRSFLLFIEERINLIKGHLAIARKGGEMNGLADMARIDEYEKLVSGLLNP